MQVDAGLMGPLKNAGTAARELEQLGYDGVIEPGMTLCVESFIGGPDTAEGVKLEQQILVTETGTELMSDYPFDEALLG